MRSKLVAVLSAAALSAALLVGGAGAAQAAPRVIGSWGPYSSAATCQSNLAPWTNGGYPTSGCYRTSTYDHQVQRYVVRWYFQVYAKGWN